MRGVLALVGDVIAGKPAFLGYFFNQLGVVTLDSELPRDLAPDCPAAAAELAADC